MGNTAKFAAVRAVKSSPSVAASPFSMAEWRAINLRAQALLSPPTDVAACVRQLGYVQIDSIQVAARAHQHVLHTRMGHYTPQALDDALEHKSLFEYWSHAAAYLPIEDYRFSLVRKQALKSGERHWFEKDQQEMQSVLARIRAEGPLKAADFENKGHAAGQWWDWKPAKKALEQLFMEGEIMVARRDGFQKVFDLPERVLPQGICKALPTQPEFARHLITTYLRAHGYGSVKTICYLRSGIKSEVVAMLNEMQLAGELASFSHQGELVYFSPSLNVPHVPDKVWLLNPFDNLLIQRARLKQWFDFDYQIEVYVPQEKRRFGYYCLAVLWRDGFIGRVDVKAERDKGLLRLKHFYVEDCALVNKACLPRMLEALSQAFSDFCRFNGLQRWKLEDANNMLIKRHFSRQVWL